MKIDTAYIKASVTCDECESNKLKRRHKQSFTSVIDYDGNVVPEFKVNWRVYECQDCETLMHVTDNGNEMLWASEYPMLPFSCFDFVVYKMTHEDDENESILEMFYKENINEEYVCEDDVRDYHILGFEPHFKGMGYTVDNIMENTWELYSDGEFLDEAALAQFKAHVVVAGSNHDNKALEDIKARL